MPTIHKRIQITDDLRVQRIIDVGSARWPGRRPSAVLVSLAEERANQLLAGSGHTTDEPTANLITVSGPPITTGLVEQILADED